MNDHEAIAQQAREAVRIARYAFDTFGHADRVFAAALDRALELAAAYGAVEALTMIQADNMPADWTKDGRRIECPEAYGSTKRARATEWCLTCRLLTKAQARYEAAAAAVRDHAGGKR